MRYISQKEAIEIDQELMGPSINFKLDQLIELAGLSAVSAIQDVLKGAKQSVCLVCGPGNNGNDGLVIARYLCMYGFEVTLWIPRSGCNSQHLLDQAISFGAILSCDSSFDLLQFDVLIDCIFGFSFSKGPVREPYANTIRQIIDAKKINKSLVVISLDIPSGWGVDDDAQTNQGLADSIQPDVIISLMLPKICTIGITHCRHYVAGRFIPPAIIKKFNIIIPNYPPNQLYLEL